MDDVHMYMYKGNNRSYYSFLPPKYSRVDPDRVWWRAGLLGVDVLRPNSLSAGVVGSLMAKLLSNGAFSLSDILMIGGRDNP